MYTYIEILGKNKMNTSFPTPVVDNANMFQDNFLMYEGSGMYNTADAIVGHIKSQQTTERSGSDCTSQDGGSRDDSSDDTGDGEDGAHKNRQMNTQAHNLSSIKPSTAASVSSTSRYTLSSATASNKRKRGSSKSVTEDQKVIRRDRNREHAKQSRLRKKSILQSLQSSLEVLQRQNDKLRLAISEKVTGLDQIMKVKVNNQNVFHCENNESRETFVRESQRRFLARVENDVDLIFRLLN